MTIQEAVSLVANHIDVVVDVECLGTEVQLPDIESDLGCEEGKEVECSSLTWFDEGALDDGGRCDSSDNGGCVHDSVPGGDAS
jgi:hypothetical protein